jgi:RNA polymerase sigma-70 factor, ECF subfamily
VVAGHYADNSAWVAGLAGSGPGRERAAARLRELLTQTGQAELARRGAGRPGDALAGPQLRPAVEAALAAINANLDGYAGPASFPLWARKFVIAEVAGVLAHGAWRRQPVLLDDPAWAARLAAAAGARNEADEHRWAPVLTSLRAGLSLDLSRQQRAVFLAVVLDGVPLDVLALELGSSRSGVYQSLFEARRRLRGRLLADGLSGPAGPGLPAAPPGLASLLSMTSGDCGCDVAFLELHGYAHAELDGRDPAAGLPAVGAHLRGCAACRDDYRGLLAAGG